MIDTTQLELDTNEALSGVNAEIARLRNERKEINVRLAELDLERRRIRRIANAFRPRPSRKADTDGGSE